MSVRHAILDDFHQPSRIVNLYTETLGALGPTITSTEKAFFS